MESRGMERSPVQAALQLDEAFRGSVTEALCRLGDCRRTFDATADVVETLLRQRLEIREARPSPGDGGSGGLRVTRRGYALFWAGVLAGAMASFAAGYWVAHVR